MGKLIIKMERKPLLEKVSDGGGHGSKVTMVGQHDDELNQRRTSKREVKAKRKIDFVYEVSNKAFKKQSANNNAQIVEAESENKGGRSSLKKAKLSKDKEICKNSGKTSKKLKTDLTNKCVFDGIQVSINLPKNSDEEQLDYEDDLIWNDEDDGSFGAVDSGDERVVSPRDLHGCDVAQNNTATATVSDDVTALELGATSTSLTDE